MKNSLLLACLTTYLYCFAQLSQGDIQFVGWYGDNLDGFAFVTMANIPDGTVIYFNDNEWNGSPVGLGGGWITETEGSVIWTNNSGGTLPAGIVVIVEGIDAAGSETVSCGAISLGTTGNGTIRVNASNEVIYAYLGTDESTPTTFLAAIANDGFGHGSITNTGLTDGINAINFGVLDADADVAVYNPPTATDYSQISIMDVASNWRVEDGSGDQGQNAISPNFPDDVPPGNEPCGVIVALPVELNEFIAFENNHKVELVWSTDSEINNDYFDIYRSSDGYSFSRIGRVKGYGNSSIEIHYNFLDEDPVEGISYYQLNQVDFDGTITKSNIESIEIKESEGFQIDVLYPNPFVHDEFNIVFKQKTSDLSISIYSMTGIEIPISIFENGLGYVVRGEFSKGVYFVKITSKDQVELIKLLRV